MYLNDTPYISGLRWIWWTKWLLLFLHAGALITMAYISGEIQWPVINNGCSASGIGYASIYGNFSFGWLALLGYFFLLDNNIYGVAYLFSLILTLGAGAWQVFLTIYYISYNTDCDGWQFCVGQCASFPTPPPPPATLPPEPPIPPQTLWIVFWVLTGVCALFALLEALLILYVRTGVERVIAAGTSGHGGYDSTVSYQLAQPQSSAGFWNNVPPALGGVYPIRSKLQDSVPLLIEQPHSMTMDSLPPTQAAAAPITTVSVPGVPPLVIQSHSPARAKQRTPSNSRRPKEDLPN